MGVIMGRKSTPKSGGSRKAAAAASEQIIVVWEDDPEPAITVERPVPKLANKPLAFFFKAKAPPAGRYQIGTPEFRYWVTAEALRRGADFWARRVPGAKWQIGDTLPVLLDEGEDLNAYYDRKALNFFHGEGASGAVVYSAESPDIACHEMGHAILDAVKPQLWAAASDEAAAFHEAFGDISAVLSALQLPSLRGSILADTKGHLYRSSRLSRLAEQLGSAIRAVQPDAVDANCLRNVVNSFTYTDPLHLPSSAPASLLSSEPHSFSRVFSGAFFECLAGMLAVKAAKPETPTSDELLAVGNEIADILVRAVQEAPVVPNFYAQVAGKMVSDAGSVNKNYPAVLKGVFVRRSILSLHSATHVETLHVSLAAARAARMVSSDTQSSPLDYLALPGGDYGLAQPLFVCTASHPRHAFVEAGREVVGAWDPPSSSTAARSFTEDLFRRGSVDYNEASGPQYRLGHSRRAKSHHVAKAPGGYQLERRMFDCGFGGA